MLIALNSQCPPSLKQQVLQRLEHELIERRKVRLARHECFALLTPLIDQFIQQLRAPLQTTFEAQTPAGRT
ncbi:MAG: hypothetical protein CUR33_10375 [Pseudomonas sp.]|uniref:hypothetical protein n=1 Tax=Pseudomonas sp. FEMGT703P TaxID=2080764 RepID=UPI000CB7E9DF|nr:hypothetical protein [Pseudomonas sp. FEMGT703P]PJE41805.1 MAG: hypothetical protein CUR33_10375 [Pseudomonas sp.] [Pseudomonas sp. FEMGT703P]